MLQHDVWVKGCESNGCIEMSRGTGGGDVEFMLFDDGGIGFRDGAGEQLRFTREEWDNFRAAAKLGEFDLQ